MLSASNLYKWFVGMSELMTCVTKSCCEWMHNFFCSWCLQSFLKHLADKAGLNLAQYIGTGTFRCVATAASRMAVCPAFAIVAVGPLDLLHHQACHHVNVGRNLLLVMLLMPCLLVQWFSSASRSLVPEHDAFAHPLMSTCFKPAEAA